MLPLALGINAIITEIDKENKIIFTKDNGEEGILGDDCLIDCSQIPMIYCNYDTQDVVDITLDDLQVGDDIILTIRSSEIENHCGKTQSRRNRKSQSVRSEIWREPEHTTKMAVKL